VEIICTVCGKKYIITPLDQDYDKLRLGKSKAYVCQTCAKKITLELYKGKKETEK